MIASNWYWAYQSYTPVSYHCNVLANSFQVILDLGRKPEARFASEKGGEYLRDKEVHFMNLQHIRLLFCKIHALCVRALVPPV